MRVNLDGEVPEWLNGTVSKTVVALVATVGSNPTLSAEIPLSLIKPNSMYRPGRRVRLWDGV